MLRNPARMALKGTENMHRKHLPALVILLAAAGTVLAVTPQFWENFTQEDLLKGTLTRVSLSADGKLSLAPAYDLVYDTKQPFIFSMVRDKSGNIYAGTGHEGKVIRIDPKGNGSVYFESKELDIYALAIDESNVLYVGTSPDGKIYKVTGPGQSTEFCDPEDKYVWSLLFDEAGNLYAGTGGRGLILKVDRGGKKSVLYDSDDTHITALARTGDGLLIAGTSPGGMLMSINAQGKAFTLLDTPLEEIRALSLDRYGTIYAAAASSRGLPAAQAGKTEITLDTSSGALPIATIQALSSIGEKPKESATSVSAPGGQKDGTGARAVIYAVSKEGGVETVYTSREQIVYDVVARNDGTVLAALGETGRLLSIDAAKQVTVITDSPMEQATRLVPDADTVWVAGSNQGKVYKLQSQHAADGTYESKLLDAKTVASWGRICWRVANPGAAVEISTRSGNTDKPDKTWSDWSQPYTDPSGQQVLSPRARYLQWRANFKRRAAAGGGDTLEWLQIAYLQQNLRPQVVSISLLPYGIALQKQPALPSGTLSLGVTTGETTAPNSPRERGKERQPLAPRQVLQPGAQSLTWKATDDNDDTLEYALYFKGDGESDWKLLQKEVSDMFYTLDAASLPDGMYALKVVASDKPSNPFGKFLIGELVSRPFLISNSTPALEITGQKIQG
ncbi:MAG: WD40 repeat domain-containing protein, partial [Acidobacteria bacterium]|nr:WD40 repeat domain-containing protein [Acidobacteriota bacterium]